MNEDKVREVIDQLEITLIQITGSVKKDQPDAELKYFLDRFMEILTKLKAGHHIEVEGYGQNYITIFNAKWINKLFYQLKEYMNGKN